VDGLLDLRAQVLLHEHAEHGAVGRLVGAGDRLDAGQVRVEVERKGTHNNPEFRVAVDVPALQPAEGVGRSKRAAEQAAAAAMLTREGVSMDAANG